MPPKPQAMVFEIYPKHNQWKIRLYNTKNLCFGAIVVVKDVSIDPADSLVYMAKFKTLGVISDS